MERTLVVVLEYVRKNSKFFTVAEMSAILSISVETAWEALFALTASGAIKDVHPVDL